MDKTCERELARWRRDRKRVIENSIEVLIADRREIDGQIENQRRKLKEIER